MLVSFYCHANALNMHTNIAIINTIAGIIHVSCDWMTYHEDTEAFGLAFVFTASRAGITLAPINKIFS